FGARQGLRENCIRNNPIRNSRTGRLLSSPDLGDVRLHRKWCRTNVNETELITPRSRCASDGMRNGRNSESVDSPPPSMAKGSHEWASHSLGHPANHGS